MGTKSIFQDNITVQHLKSIPFEKWGETEILHLYQELENVKREIDISSVVPSTISDRVQLQYLYAWLNNYKKRYEEEREHKSRLQPVTQSRARTREPISHS